MNSPGPRRAAVHDERADACHWRARRGTHLFLTLQRSGEDNVEGARGGVVKHCAKTLKPVTALEQNGTQLLVAAVDWTIIVVTVVSLPVGDIPRTSSENFSDFARRSNNPSVHADMSSGRPSTCRVARRRRIKDDVVITFAVLFQQDGDALQECGLMRAWRMLG